MAADQPFSVSRTTAILVLVGLLASPAAAAGIMQWRLAEAERRIEALENNARWQNELLYRIDEKLKLAPWAGPKS